MQNIVESLTPLERKVLPHIKQNISLKDLESKTKLKEAEISRAVRLLENKNLITVKKDFTYLYKLAENGKKYLKLTLPELQFLNAIKNKQLNLEELKSATSLSQEEINISIGQLRKKDAIKVNPGQIFQISFEGKNILKNEYPEQKLLEKISNNKISKENFSNEEDSILRELQRRKQIIEQIPVTSKLIIPTQESLKLSKSKLDINMEESLTPEMLKTGSWKNKKFRRYDLEADVPRVYPGKRHFVYQSIEHAKRIWLDMGFEEMTGPMVDSSFWNFDALFTPQDHPAREMQDTFFLDGKAKLPNKELVEKVKSSHEKSWGYSWNPEEAKKPVLRTHTTLLSARTLSKLKEQDLPKKFFAISRNYRNEAVDWSHLFELDQSEGIVIDENANFKNLLGYLKQFFKKMGYNQVRFRPAHFPYTEPSVEIDVYVEEKNKWMELGGAGIFRPEMVIPLLGKDIPVLAWGLGMGRSLTNYYHIKDIRELYKNDIKQLREIKAWT